MTLRVLIIEDTYDLGEILVEILKSEGFDATWTVNPLDGLKLFFENPFDAVITDVVMEGMDGLSVIRTIRTKEQFSKTPLIVLSARASPEDENESYKAGASLHLKKPCPSVMLISAIKTLLR